MEGGGASGGGGALRAQQAIKNLAWVLLHPRGGGASLRHRRVLPARPHCEAQLPDEITVGGGVLQDLSADSIRQKAAEVGARVDALQINGFAAQGAHAMNHDLSMKPSWFHDEIDLNKKPEPEDPSAEDW
ncbi:UNVERIFIED_CONTAM: hypothetical protein Sradi_4219500 [Sesamum radiatum]|uniref:Uncharacterized protein n=1 Tax=Sesamum radiatum TaxID=300843 RepID=A0AAW2P5V5_SESRA